MHSLPTLSMRSPYDLLMQLFHEFWIISLMKTIFFPEFNSLSSNNWSIKQSTISKWSLYFT